MSKNTQRRKYKILFLVTKDRYFYSHRLDLAKAALLNGYDVCVVTDVKDHGEQIRAAGFKLIPIAFHRTLGNPFGELAILLNLVRIYRKEHPNLIHHVALKPIVYGSIAAKIANMPLIVNAITGLGWVFCSHHTFAKLLKLIMVLFLKRILRFDNTHTIFQNTDDISTLESFGISARHNAIIRGSGVDPSIYTAGKKSEKIEPLRVLLAARMLWSKGVGEFVQAARILRQRNVNARFVLVGGFDSSAKDAIPENTLHEWQQEGIVEWLGLRDDMPRIFRQSAICCLPSNREGIPRVLLEAASAALPIITTDATGCREVVLDGENGYLIPLPVDAKLLADTIEKLLADPALRKTMGEKGRNLVKNTFSSEIIIKQTLDIYDKLLREKHDDHLR